MKGYDKKNCFELLFLLLQATLYVTFLFLDLTDGSIGLSVCIKYIIIILCFCYALLCGSAYKSIFYYEDNAQKSVIGLSLRKKLGKHPYADIRFLQMGLFFTLISDLFILILDYYLYGVLVFILVQQLYSFRLILLHYGKRDQSERITMYVKRIMIQVGLAAMTYLALYFAGVNLDSLLITSVFYFISILFNTIAAVQLAIKNHRLKSDLLYAAGMLLFLLCDINVGLFNLTGFINLPEEIYSVIYSYSSILMWTFYAPSQVLVALSVSYIVKQKEALK